MIITNVKKFGYMKSRPKAHKLEGITTKQHGGMVLSAYPRPYPITSQQKKVRDAAKACDIHKGMKRSDLVDKMVNCMKGKI